MFRSLSTILSHVTYQFNNVVPLPHNSPGYTFQTQNVTTIM